MEMMSIASGSSGNCIYIGTDNTHILVDAGISCRNVTAGLNEIGLSLEDIDAILITHEHDDHIKGLGVLERKCEIPVFGTAGTLNYVSTASKLGYLPPDIYNYIRAGSSFFVGDIEVGTVSISHDAVDPVAYSFKNNDKKIGVATDMGKYDDAIIECFKETNALLIEANHDINMLQLGSYPYYLKNRILGDKGHLSNEACGKLLSRLLNDRLERIFLGHLSRENNFPELAYETVKLEINQSDSGYNANEFNIQVAKRNSPSELIKV